MTCQRDIAALRGQLNECPEPQPLKNTKLTLTCPPDFPPDAIRVRLGKDGHMKRRRFTEEQIIGVLKESEAGVKTADLARKHGISEATFYNWKAKYGGLEVSEAQRLRALEDENGRLKRLLADAMLDNAGLKDLLAKKW